MFHCTARWILSDTVIHFDLSWITGVHVFLLLRDYFQQVSTQTPGVWYQTFGILGNLLWLKQTCKFDSARKKMLTVWFTRGSKWLLLNVPQVKGDGTIGSIVWLLRWPGLLLSHFPRDGWRPPLCRFSHWPPHNLWSHRTPSECWHRRHLILHPQDKSVCENFREHGKI